ncbi:MAG: hypothetical protein AB1758_25805, partial [Candidatus Eremiobacterota bacterium]
MSGRQCLKRLYSCLHIKPGPRAQAILFDDRPPEDSRLAALRQLASTREPAEQAALIRRFRLPYRAAAGLLVDHPETAQALVEQMSPQEVINHMAWLKRKGYLEHEAIRKRVEEALQRAGRHRRVSALKAQQAARAVDLGDDWQALLDRVTQQRLESQAGWITRPTAVLVDASASMEEALEVGRRLASMISAVARGPLYVFTFNQEVQPVQPESPDYAGWSRSFERLEPRGATSAGRAVLELYRQGQFVEQLVVISDQRENHRPAFESALRLYRRRARRLELCFVNVGQPARGLEQAARRLRLQVRSLDFRGDYYALPNLLPFLTQPSLTALYLEILEAPLPRR